MILIVYGLYYIYNHEQRTGLLYVMCMFLIFCICGFIHSGVFKAIMFVWWSYQPLCKQWVLHDVLD